MFYIKLTRLTCLLVLCYNSKGKSEIIFWNNHRVLDEQGIFHVKWIADGDSIAFKVDVVTKGYVGFGFSPHGTMEGSDFVTGWIKDGIPYFQDRHQEEGFAVKIDDSQDWHLIEGTENDTHTTLVFIRKLDTCDEDDLIIESTMHAVYAFASEDPESPEKLMYHGCNRGSQTISILQPDRRKRVSIKGLLHWDFLSNEYTLESEVKTTYWCSLVKGPELQEKNHITKFEPIFQRENGRCIHHMTLYECDKISPEEYLAFGLHYEEGYKCSDSRMFKIKHHKCKTAVATWGEGLDSVEFPEHAGFPLGFPTKYFLLEIHYENSGYYDGITDRSGFKMYYTSKLRKYDAGMIAVGVISSINIIIPPGQEKFTIAGHADPKCLQSSMPKDGINIIGVACHAHTLARHIKVRHFRKNTELPLLADEKSFRFNYQVFRFLPEEVKLSPGDQITVECTYNSRNRENTTFGGPSVTDEMCLAVLLYYPKMRVLSSLSGATLPLIMGLTGILEEKNGMIQSPAVLANTALVQYLTTYDWKKMHFSIVENALRYAPQINKCSTSSGNEISNVISYPRNLTIYVKSECLREDKSTKKTEESEKTFRKRFKKLLSSNALYFL